MKRQEGPGSDGPAETANGEKSEDSVPEPRTGRDEDLFLFNGRPHRITLGPACQVREGVVLYDTPRNLKKFLTGLLLDETEQLIQRFQGRLPRPSRICVRMQQTRWGSCSGVATLNLNLLILSLPPHLREYILLHELVHLEERNHSSRFWKRLSSFCPDCRECRRELRSYGPRVDHNRIWRVIQGLK